MLLFAYFQFIAEESCSSPTHPSLCTLTGIFSESQPNLGDKERSRGVRRRCYNKCWSEVRGDSNCREMHGDTEILMSFRFDFFVADPRTSFPRIPRLAWSHVLGVIYRKPQEIGQLVLWEPGVSGQGCVEGPEVQAGECGLRRRSAGGDPSTSTAPAQNSCNFNGSVFCFRISWCQHFFEWHMIKNQKRRCSAADDATRLCRRSSRTMRGQRVMMMWGATGQSVPVLKTRWVLYIESSRRDPKAFNSYLNSFPRVWQG